MRCFVLLFNNRILLYYPHLTPQLVLVFFCFINFPILPSPPTYVGVMGAAEATGLSFVCFVVINPCVLSANGVDLGFFVSHIFQFFSFRSFGSWLVPFCQYSRYISFVLPPPPPRFGNAITGLDQRSNSLRLPLPKCRRTRKRPKYANLVYYISRGSVRSQKIPNISINPR